MDETDLIITVQNDLDSRLSVPVRTSALDDERPVPGVILDEWSTTDITVHNKPVSRHLYKDFDGDGNREVERWYNFYYETRIDFNIRHDSQPGASRLKDEVKNAFRDWRQDHEQLHDHIQWVRLVNSGDPQFFFGEPKESELGAGVLIRTFHRLKKRGQDDGLDPLEAIQTEFSNEDFAQ